MIPLVHFCAGVPYIILYFVSPLNSTFAYVLQIIGATFSVIMSSTMYMMLSKHAPLKGTAKIYAFNSFVSSLISLGITYLFGWMLDSPYNKESFLLLGALPLSIVLLFACCLLCCPSVFRKEKTDNF